METSSPDLKTDEQDGSFWSYFVGFILSILLTLSSYFFVSNQIVEGWHLILAISGLALLQVIVQVVLFLHLGSKAMPSWSISAFFFMINIVLIIVIGSLWIMSHLDYNMGMGDMEKKIPKESM